MNRDECRSDDLIGKYQPDITVTTWRVLIHIYPKKTVYVVVSRLFTVDIQYSALRNGIVVALTVRSPPTKGSLFYVEIQDRLLVIDGKNW